MSHGDIASELLATPSIGPGFVAPHYEGRGIANVVPTIMRAFGVADGHAGLDPEILPPALLDGVRRIVYLTVDALGYRQLLGELDRQPDLFFGTLLRRDGVAFAPLTSVFPSTTVNALTTIYTGAQPIEHGLVATTLYLREVGAMSQMIRFGPSVGGQGYAHAGVDPVAFQPLPTIYERLREVDVAAFMVNYHEWPGSPMTRWHARGAEYVPYLSLPTLVARVRQLLERPAPARMVVGAYYGTLDALCHATGTGTDDHAAEVAGIDFVLRHELFERVRQPETLFLLLADHGHRNCVPERVVNLAEHPPLVEDLVVPPTGEPRARYLHVRHGRRETVRDYLAEHFKAIGVVLTADEAVAGGLFGGATPMPAARERIGDLVLLAREGWYFHYDPTRRPVSAHTFGAHGGLTPEEMLVPLLALRLG